MVTPCSPGGASAQAAHRHSWGMGPFFSALPLGLPPLLPSCPLPHSGIAGPGSSDIVETPWPLNFVSPLPLSMAGGWTTTRLLQPWGLSRLHLDLLAPLEHCRSFLSSQSQPLPWGHHCWWSIRAVLLVREACTSPFGVGRLLVPPCQVDQLGRAQSYLCQVASLGLSNGGGLSQPHSAWLSEGYYFAHMCVLWFPYLFLLEWCLFAFVWMCQKDGGHLKV